MTTGGHGQREVGCERSEAGAEDTGCDYDDKIHVNENATKAIRATSGAKPRRRDRRDHRSPTPAPQTLS
jgi:hypothetical protein